MRYLEPLVQSWCQDYAGIHYLAVDRQAGECWSKTILALDLPLHDCQVYACGSPDRVYRTFDRLQQHGLHPKRFQSDVFAYAPRPSSSQG